MSALVMHVGGPKVGSTALQRVLSQRAWRPRRGRPFLLAQWRVDGTLVEAPPGAQDTLGGYALSDLRLGSLGGWSGPEADRAGHALASLAGQAPVVLSNEGWASEALALDEPGRSALRRVLASSGLRSEAVLFVRPQAPWIESFYLQFAIWRGLDIDTFARNMVRGREGMWAARVRALEELGFDDVTVRYADDVVPAFLCDVLGVSPADPRLAAEAGGNQRVSLDLLLLMLANRDLRPDMHSPQVEFLVERLGPQWKLPQRPVPPLLGERLVEEVVAAFDDDNRELLGLLPAAEAEAFERRVAEFTQSRRGTELVTREALAAQPLDRDYMGALVAGALDEVMRTRYGVGLPTAPDHWTARLRDSSLARRLLPPGTGRASLAARVAERFR